MKNPSHRRRLIALRGDEQLVGVGRIAEEEAAAAAGAAPVMVRRAVRALTTATMNISTRVTMNAMTGASIKKRKVMPVLMAASRSELATATNRSFMAYYVGKNGAQFTVFRTLLLHLSWNQLIPP